MADIKRGPIRRYVGLNQSYLEHLVSGQVATDGVVYGAVVTVGTTAVEVFNRLVNPGFSLGNKGIQVGLTQRFTELTGSVGSVYYQWDARSEFVNADGSINTLGYAQIGATYAKGVAASSTSEDTHSGYLNTGSLPGSPIRFRLTAVATGAARVTGQVKNSSFVEIDGIVIPGT